MEIVFFHWSVKCGYSITRSFEPLIAELKKRCIVKEYRVPYAGANPINIIKNILFVYKHRTSVGINHITGDIHYCVLGLIGAKSVLTIHDDYAIIKAPNLWNKIYKWFFWIYLPVKLADRTECITDETYRKISQYVHSRKMRVFTPHALYATFHFMPHTFNKIRPHILQIGTDTQKNLETTLQTLAGMKCHLRIIGKMTSMQHRLAQNLKIDYSNLYGLTDEEIIHEYEKADIVAFPSLYEGFGMPIIEAQAIGRVVITSNRAPMNWVAGDGAALLNNPLDIYEYRSIINKLINDDNYRECLIAKGIKNVTRFNAIQIAMEYMVMCQNS